jgi:hypothetical protein
MIFGTRKMISRSSAFLMKLVGITVVHDCNYGLASKYSH